MAVAEQVVIDLIARTDALERGLDRSAKGFDRVGKSAGALKGILAGYLGLQSAEKILGYAETYKAVDAQLRLATATYGDFSKAQEDAERIAAATRGGIKETTALYGNFLRASEQNGKSQKDAATATESFATALKIGGADAATAASATLQFGQALASGALRGDEFNSIAEASPRILKLLADSLGVPQGALRKLAEEGKLTTEKLFKALGDPKIVAGLKAELATIPPTFDDAMTSVENAAIQVFGKFDQGGQFSSALASFVSDGGKGFDSLADDALDFGVQARAVIEGLDTVFQPLVDAGRAAFEFLNGAAAQSGFSVRESLQQSFDQVRTFTKLVAGIRLGGARLDDIAPKGFFGSDTDNAAAAFRRSSAESERQSLSRIRDQELKDRFRAARNANNRPPPRVNPDDKDAGKAAKKAEREAAAAAKKAAREAAAANRELEQSLNQLQSAYDPAAVAADRYAEEIKKIDALVKGGKLSPDDAFLYRFRAATELAQATRKATEDLVGLMNNLRPFDGADTALRQTIDGIDNAREQGLPSAAGQSPVLPTEAEYEDQQQKIKDLADLFTESFTAGSGDIFENFKRQGLRALAVLIARFAVLQATQGNGGFGNILKNIGGAFNQGGGIAGIAGMFGRASGGHVAAGQLVRVNEGASPGNVEGWRPQGSGQVIPLGRMKAARPSGGTTVLQTIAVDARGAVMADTFARQILARADGNARQVVGAASTAQRKGLPAASARLSTLGTS